MSKSNSYSTNGILSEAINTKLSRRSFLKWSAAIGATASGAGLVASAKIQKAQAVHGEAAPNSVSEVVEWVPTHCLMCHSWCSLCVGIDADGLARKIEGQGGQPAFKGRPGVATDYPGALERLYFTAGGAGSWGNLDDAHWPAEIAAGEGHLPYGLNNKGRICAKGNAGLDTLYDPDRIKYPLERIGDRGEGRWTRISWREAYWKVASVLRELRGYTTAPDGVTPVQTVTIAGKPIGRARGQDLRHRMVHYVGRNESDNGGGGLAFGTPNHVEHTALCESSRHQSTHTMFGHHFPFPDIVSHSGTRAPAPGGKFASNPLSSVDFMLEIGGNPTEAKIPMTSYGVRWGDRKRDGCRQVVVDVRQSNTASFADEYLAVNPGTDGALVMGIMYEMFANWGTTTNPTVAPAVPALSLLETELLAGHLGGSAFGTRRWLGIFDTEIGSGTTPDAGAGAGTQAFAAGGPALPGVGAAQTLESELQSLIGIPFGLPASVGAGAGWAAGITGLAASDITYLAAAVSGGQATAGPPTFDPALAAAYLNPSIDGYRGPSKHTDGTYAWRAIRTLQVICGRFQIDAAKIFDPAQASGTFARGGIERPGGLIVNGWGANDAGVIGTYSIAGTLSGAGGNSATSPAVPGAALGPLPRHTYPYASNKWNGVHDTVTIDRWDYDKGRTKSGAGTQGMDQNLVPGMRASLGLHPYKVGQLAKVRRSEAEVGDVILPYGFRQTAYIACDAAPVDLGGPGPYRISVGPQAALANMVGGSATIYQDSDVQVAAGTVVAANTVTGEIDLSVDPTAGLTGGVTAIGDHLVVDLLDASIPDKDFEVEVLSLFKNGPGNTRPNIKLDQELFLSKWGEDEKTDRQGEYRINFIYSTDAFMGDATRFADIILPDTSYLERFDNKDWENMGLKGWWGMRQPVMRQNMAKDIWADDAKDLYLYEARPVNSIQQELSNAVAGNLTTAGTGFGLTYDGGGGHPIYNANLGDEDYDPGVAGVEGQAWDTIRLGGIGAHKANYYEKLAGSGVPSLSIAATASDTSWAFARVFGNMHDANQVIDEYTGFDSVFGGHGGWAKQNAPRTWLDDDLCAVGNVEADWADTGLPGALRGYTALEIFNKRETQILEPGMDAAVLPPFTSSVGYKFRGLPTFQGSAQQVSGGYPRHLTTYKLNVHTQSRTAQNALLTEIIGACWAVIGATGTDATGLTATDDNGATIRSGDRVKVQTKQGFVKLEAKVTDKAQAGVVSISNSFGHEKKGQDSDTIGTSQGVSTVYGSSNAFGAYYVDGKLNREYTSDYPGYAGDPVDVYRVEYPATAPGRSVHPNQAINRTHDNIATSASLAYDPVGTSLGWFDSKCKVTKA